MYCMLDLSVRFTRAALHLSLYKSHVFIIIITRGANSSRLDSQGVYMCPVYKTEQRGPTYVFSSQLKTKLPPARWILAGVALLLDVV